MFRRNWPARWTLCRQCWRRHVGRARSMRVPVVLVREVFVRVRHRGVAMSMGVSSGVHFARRMMFVVEVVLVLVLVFEGLVFMQMLVPFCQVQPDAQCHQRAGHEQRGRHRFGQGHHGEYGA